MGVPNGGGRRKEIEFIVVKEEENSFMLGIKLSGFVNSIILRPKTK